MAHDAQTAAHAADSGRFVFRIASTARARRQARMLARRPSSVLPEIGPDDVILPAVEKTLDSFAMRAQQGDRIARDALYHAYLPKLARLSRSIRPPFAPDSAEGIWSRDDVAQETYLVFVDLVDSWAGDVSFTSYLLSRFAWRVKDVIFRGIGKPAAPPRWRTVPIEDASLDSAIATPEGVAMLERVIDGLPGMLVTLLFAHAIEGRSQTAIAREMGVSRRTMARYWGQIRAHAVEALTDGGGVDSGSYP